jgi:hypothetical protein
MAGAQHREHRLQKPGRDDLDWNRARYFGGIELSRRSPELLAQIGGSFKPI